MFLKGFFSLWKNYGKCFHRDIKLAKTKKRRGYLSVQIKLSHKKIDCRKSTCNRNGWNKYKNEQTSLSRPFNFGY